MKTRIVFTFCFLATLFFSLPSGISQNLLTNGDFNQPNAAGTSSSFTRTSPNVGGGPSGAHAWTTWVNGMNKTVETKLVPSPKTGGRMLRVRTNGVSNGIVQRFAPIHTGPEKATACVWLYVESGSVCVGLGDGGNTHCSMTLTESGQWERITVGSGVSPVNQIIIYSASPSTEFIVESAAVFPGPPEKLEECCRPE